MRLRHLTIAGAVVASSLALTLVATGGASGASLPNTKVIPGACALDLRADHSHCDLSLIATLKGEAKAAAAPTAGYGPADLRSAYALPSSGGSGQTVAIVDAFGDTTAEADMNTYRSNYGLPACTTANGCFKKVNQNGVQGSYPANNQGWALETQLDLEMVSAVCPGCKILLVEATSNINANLYAAEDTAARLGATEISNSYGEAEYPGESLLEPFFNQPGVMITAASGDSGYGVGYPAASANVTSVGGTSLWQSSGSRGWSERPWVGTGSGCATFIPKPSWQHDGCTHRTDNDTAAVADPGTPVAVYDSFGVAGWVMVGGTSAASPIVAAVYALAEDAHHAPGGSYFYDHPDNVFDVTSGIDGTCSPAYLCGAGTGYDAPTGLGTPDLTGSSDTGSSCVSGWSRTPAYAAPTEQQVALAEVPLVTAPVVDALAKDDVWTVGSYEVVGRGPAGSTGFITSIEHWNGAKWQQFPSPTPVTLNGSVNAQLLDVSFDQTDDGWAVGHSGSNVLVAHWDGTRWSLSPALDPIVSYLQAGGDTVTAAESATAVAAISPNDVWLAGNAQNGNVQHGAFLEHWDGSTWRLVDVPDTGTLPIVLTGMHEVSATDIWAVGYRQDNATGAVTEPISLHWDGQSWTVVPVAGGANTALRAISGSSATDLWAVGSRSDPDMGSVVPLTEHWDGTAWTIVATQDAASVASNRTILRDVAVVSPSNAWAVGAYSGRRANQPNFGGLYLLEHWDGHTWSIVPAPQAATDDGLWSISASSAGNVWLSAIEQLPGTLNYPYALRYGCSNG
jgi:hypothetical protein